MQARCYCDPHAPNQPACSNTLQVLENQGLVSSPTHSKPGNLASVGDSDLMATSPKSPLGPISATPLSPIASLSADSPLSPRREGSLGRTGSLPVLEALHLSL